MELPCPLTKYFSGQLAKPTEVTRQGTFAYYYFFFLRLALCHSHVFRYKPWKSKEDKEGEVLFIQIPWPLVASASYKAHRSPSYHWCCLLCGSKAHTTTTGRYQWNHREVLAWFWSRCLSMAILGQVMSSEGLGNLNWVTLVKKPEEEGLFVIPKGVSLCSW